MLEDTRCLGHTRRLCRQSEEVKAEEEAKQAQCWWAEKKGAERHCGGSTRAVLWPVREEQV